MMIVSHFMKWVNTARAAERAAAAGALARAYVQHDLLFEERCAAEGALTFLLDDPSPRVRRAMAEALAMSRHAPPQVILALAADQPEVSEMVLARSPLLADTDLIELAAAGTDRAQALIADRATVSMELSAAIAEVACAQACRALVSNAGADIAALSFRRIAERFGHVGPLREVLIADRRLPADCRHMLLVMLGQALRDASLVVALMGAPRAERITRDACAKAALTLIDGTDAADYPALIAHLRLRGDLTTSFLVRALAHGKVGFFGAVLAALSGQPDHRVTSLLQDGSDVALRAVFRNAALPESAHTILLRALKTWRDVANGRSVAGTQEVAWAMLAELGGTQVTGDLAALLKSIHLEALRGNAREHALALAAA